jgi:hypothetical protein
MPSLLKRFFADHRPHRGDRWQHVRRAGSRRPLPAAERLTIRPDSLRTRLRHRLLLRRSRHLPLFWLQLISIGLAMLIGFFFLRDPAQGLTTITLLLIVFFMMEGISKVVTIRPFPNWGGVLASGLVGIVLSLILWAY